MSKILFVLLFSLSAFVPVFSQTCDYIYVSTLGNDANIGTESLPVQTLSQALNLVNGSRTNIRMAGGSYTEGVIVNLQDYVHIDGAYSVAGSVWTKSTAQITTITFSGIETVSGVRHTIGFKANGISGWSLTDLTIITSNITGLDPSNRGSSNYGIWVNNCTNYTVSRCDITVGSASAGGVGISGTAGTNGSSGAVGGSGSCDGNYTCCFGSETAPGGNGGAGGQGAIGISGGASNSSTTANSFPGANGTGRNGGGGGAGGKGGGFSGGNAAVNGSNGGGSASLGQNLVVGISGVQGDPGGDGTNGSNGLNGLIGVLGSAGPSGIHATGFFVPGAQAGTGSDGTGGQGGAGGGGGGRQNGTFVNAGPGNGGSGGGGGGQGGTGGTGGHGGGGSFAIYTTASNVGASITQNRLVPGVGGAGGTGGAGGAGGIGGAGGTRNTTCTAEIGEGGAGGAGGSGGAGGQGGSGSVGFSAQLCADGVNSSPSIAIPFIPAVTANFSGCTNSEITLTKGSGIWTIQPSASFINDLNSTTSSYDESSATSIVTYSSTGFKSLVNGGITFSNYIYVSTDRPLPTFDASMNNAICEGNSFLMNTPTSGVEYEWVIFPTAGNVTTPVAIFATSVASWTTPVTGTSVNYTVRLRVRENCCGWSIPVYYNFSVSSGTVGPVATGATICENNTATITATGTGSEDIAWYSDPLGQVLLQSTPGINSTFITPVLTQNTVFFVGEGVGGCPGSLTSVQVTVNPQPAVPSASPIEICVGENAVLSASGAGGTFNWFNVPTGGASLGSGSSFNAGALAAGTYTFYVAEDNGTCSSDRTAVSVLVNALPVAPTSTPVTVCNGNSAVLSGTGTASINWYADAGLTTLLGTGATYTTVPLSSNTTYYLAQTNANGCQGPSTSVLVTVNPNVVPSMTIAASSNTICAGTVVNFTSTNANAGASPTYEWYVNGAAQSTNSANFSSATLTNGDVVSAMLTSNAACASPISATSNSVVMTVNPVVTPTITASASSTTICSGETVTFTAAGANGGSNPVYQWILNGAPVGSNSSVYTNSSLVNGDQIAVSLTSSEACATIATVTSSTITITVNPNVVPSMTIAASSNTICAGTAVNFTSTNANAGASPIYEWYVNGVAQSTNNANFSSATLANGDVVSAMLTSNAACASPISAISNSVVMTVNPVVTPTITASASSTTICSGETVTFTAAGTNGGSNPLYQWILNGAPVGSNSSVYTNSSLVNGDQIAVLLTSSEACATVATVTSSTITMTENAEVIPFAFISSPQTTICPGDAVNVTSNITNGGSTPVYDWYLNGVSTGISTPSYNSSSLNNGDILTLILTSSSACANPGTVSSNSLTFQHISSVSATVNIASLNSVLCEGETITFLASPNNAFTNLNYSWRLNGSGVGTNNPIYIGSSLSAGDVVSVDLIYDDICGNTNTVSSNTLTIAANPLVNAGADISIILGGSAQINATSSIIGVYDWTPSSSLNDATILDPVATPAVTTEYMLSVTTPEGCVSSDMIRITVNDQSVGIDNSFTPNDDGINDTWVIHNLDLYPDLSMGIYNRWGNLLYEQQNTYIPWDGKFKGEPLPSETYFYVLDLGNGQEVIKGTVTIVR